MHYRKFAQDLSSKTATGDDPVNLVLDEDLKVGNVTVAEACAKAVGTITHAKKAGMMGKGGELNLRLEYLIVSDTRMRLRGTKGKEGEGKVGAAVALTVLFGPIGLIKHGKNVEVKQGTPLLAYVDQDFAVHQANNVVALASARTEVSKGQSTHRFGRSKRQAATCWPIGANVAGCRLTVVRPKNTIPADI